MKRTLEQTTLEALEATKQYMRDTTLPEDAPPEIQEAFRQEVERRIQSMEEARTRILEIAFQQIDEAAREGSYPRRTKYAKLATSVGKEAVPEEG